MKFEVKFEDEVSFWHSDKHQSVLQVYTIILGVHSQGRSKYPK